MMFILSILIPTCLISMVLTRELSSKTDLGQFIKKHRSKPWLKDNSNWLLKYADLLHGGKEKSPQLKEVWPVDEDGHMDLAERLIRKPKADLDIDQDILDITSIVKDFINKAKKEVNSKYAKTLLGELHVAGGDLGKLRRKNNPGPVHKSLRGLERGTRSI